MGIPWSDGSGVRERVNSGSGASDHVIGQGWGRKLERTVWQCLVGRYSNKWRQQCEPATKVSIPDGCMAWLEPKPHAPLGVGLGRERVLVVSTLMFSWSKGPCKVVQTPCICSSMACAFLPLCLGSTDCETEFHWPRGATGSLFEEFLALYAYFVGGFASPEEYALFRLALATVFAISSVAQSSLYC